MQCRALLGAARAPYVRLPLRYFTKKGTGELDLVTERKDEAIIALEIKSGRGYKVHAAIDDALKIERYHIDEAYVLAECHVGRDDTLLYLPIYSIGLMRNSWAGRG